MSRLTREREVEAYLVRSVRDRGGDCEKWQGGMRGVMDRIVILPDTPIFFVEVKSPTGRLHPLQARLIERWRAMGQRVEVVTCFEDVDALFHA